MKPEIWLLMHLIKLLELLQLDHIPGLVYGLKVLVEAVALGQFSLVHHFE